MKFEKISVTSYEYKLLLTHQELRLFRDVFKLGSSPPERKEMAAQLEGILNND